MEKANSIADAVQKIYGEGTAVVRHSPMYGGDINQSWMLQLSNGERLFLKENTPDMAAMFWAEAEGLAALRSTGTIGVPMPLAAGTDSGKGVSFLMLEFLDQGQRIRDCWETFGRELAAMHRAEYRLPSGRYGFIVDNFIGSTPQKNEPRDSWVSFYRDCRLQPQVAWAWDELDPATRKRLTRLLDHLEEFLPEPQFPSLIHGDLWSGNAVCGPDGKYWVLDPATSVSHFEAELAMTQLFGGFPDAFYRAYHEVNPIDPHFRERRDLYNLYHLMNHLNLFGRSYLSSVQRIAAWYAGG